mmetsp:Transcript_103/g.307  ORF Transcript_103/g.307 Transcript_103/m.307 type:complete len:314 (-) Transcript_103:265-1206(-)
MLGRLLKQVIVRRNAAAKLGRIQINEGEVAQLAPKDADQNVLDEVKEIIHLPAFDDVVVKNQEDPDSLELDPIVLDQLESLVSMTGSLYRENPVSISLKGIFTYSEILGVLHIGLLFCFQFHNFEHASHVTMSVVKLLSRITTADTISELKDPETHSALHDFTYGITSDPLTQFACVFAALIHDVDHTGVPNATLVKEHSALAKVYKNQSVAEQNSVDLAWELFMDSEFAELRSCICKTSDELNRFRELVVNSVMATDIVDKELKALRNGRWDKAFSEQATKDSDEDAVNRKATIVIEHLIQASDVAHTMQHW